MTIFIVSPKWTPRRKALVTNQSDFNEQFHVFRVSQVDSPPKGIGDV